MSTPHQDTLTNTASAPHGARAHTDGGWSIIPVQSRAERFRSFRAEDFARVTQRTNEYRLSPVAELDDLLHGELDGSAVPFTVTQNGASQQCTITSIPHGDERIGQAGMPEERGSANAWEHATEAMLVELTGETHQVVTITRSDLGHTPRAAHVIVHARAHANAMVILEHRGEGQLSENVEIVLDEGAQLTLVSVQQWAADARHLSSHFARVGRDARLKHVVVSLGGRIVRVNPATHLCEQGGSVEALGIYVAESGQHLEQQVYVNHDAPHTTSNVLYKGALHGDGAHTVWIGDVLIRPCATGTDSYEQNRNLVLSDGTRADSIPNLEIQTGDIAGAGHASATGRFDDDQLFYLQSRGISEAEARKLVVRGFLVEVIQQIGNSELEAQLSAAIELALEDALQTTAAPTGASADEGSVA